MECRNYKNENTERKYLSITQKNQFLKVKNGLLELEKYLMDLKGIELKDRDMRIKRNTRTFFKLIFVFIEDMNRFGKKMN